MKEGEVREDVAPSDSPLIESLAVVVAGVHGALPSCVLSHFQELCGFLQLTGAPHHVHQPRQHLVVVWAETQM